MPIPMGMGVPAPNPTPNPFAALCRLRSSTSVLRLCVACAMLTGLEAEVV